MILGDVQRRLAERPSAHSLPREFYVDPDVYRLDLDAVSCRHWISVGHDIQIPNPGDYFTLALGAYQLVVIRGDDGVVRALHNVCRHRGSLLCDDAQRTVRRRMVCPYHQWLYELDGTLANARKTGVDFDPTAHGLATAACEVAAGMIFVSVADDPPDFAPMKALTRRTARGRMTDEFRGTRTGRAAR